MTDIDTLLRSLERHGLGGLNPDAPALRALAAADRDGPLQFVNLLAYHEHARYPEGHELADAGLSGAEAYNRYGVIALEHVMRRGGRLALYNDVEQTLITDGVDWHQVAIMEYPNTAAFLDMLGDDDYTDGLVHRDAGLANTAVYVTRPRLPLP